MAVSKKKSKPSKCYYGVFGCADGDREDTFLCFEVASRREAIEAFYRDMEDESDPNREVFVNLVVKSSAFIAQSDPGDGEADDGTPGVSS